MKKTMRFGLGLVVALMLVLTLGVAAVSADNGMPAAHGVDGPTFGGAVSGLAQTDPGALADHVSGCGASDDNGSGMPAAHGVDGPTFGGAVRGLATTNPGALAAHVSGR